MSQGPVVNVAPPSEPQHAIQPAPGPVAQQSEKLRSLLASPSGVPSFNTAMQPENFPFVEGCRQGKVINHGVVKIGNVSINPYFSC